MEGRLDLGGEVGTAQLEAHLVIGIGIGVGVGIGIGVGVGVGGGVGVGVGVRARVRLEVLIATMKTLPHVQPIWPRA